MVFPLLQEVNSVAKGVADTWNTTSLIIFSFPCAMLHHRNHLLAVTAPPFMFHDLAVPHFRPVLFCSVLWNTHHHIMYMSLMSDVKHRQIILLHAHLVLQSAFRVRAWLCETRFPAARRGIQLILRVSLKIHSLLWTDNQFTCQKSAVSNCSHFAYVSFCLLMCIISPTYGYDLEGLSRDKTDFDSLWLTPLDDLVGTREFRGQDWLWSTGQDDCHFEVVPYRSVCQRTAS